MDSLAQNIKYYRKLSGLTQKELAKKLSVAPTAISAWEVGRNQPLMNNIEQMSAIFGIKKSLLLGEDFSSHVDKATSPIQSIYDQLAPPRQGKVLTFAERQLDEQKNEDKTKINEVSEKIVQLYGYDYYDHAASAGTGQYLNDVRVERIDLPVDVDADFVIPIKGDSMEPDYHDGDLVFIQTSVDLNDGVIGVFNYNGEAYIKQLVIDTEQSYLHSLNPAYKDMPITPETDFRIIGEVVDLYREK